MCRSRWSRPANTNDQLPASAWFSLLLDKWPDPKIRGDFTLSCGNCHQIAAYRFRRTKTEEQWRSVLTRMMTNLPPYFQETRDLLIKNVLDTYGPNATYPTLPVPPPPSGEVLNAVLYEYILGNQTSSPGCHDLELGADNRVYADAGLRWIDPRTSERGVYPFVGGSHSIERAADGNMWITQAGSDSLAEVPVDGADPRYFPLPSIGDDQGAYPHTLRFDSQGQIWMTMTKSNHLARFDPPTAMWTYYRLPEADPAEVGLSDPGRLRLRRRARRYRLVVAALRRSHRTLRPGHRQLKAWRPPFYGPRRLSADQDGIVWVPGYGSGVLGRFDPDDRALEGLSDSHRDARPGGLRDLRDAVQPQRQPADRRGVDQRLQLRHPDPLRARRAGASPSSRSRRAASFTREIEFDPDNNIWTCTSERAAGAGRAGHGQVREARATAAGAPLRRTGDSSSARSATTATRPTATAAARTAGSRPAAATARAAAASMRRRQRRRLRRLLGVVPASSTACSAATAS